MKQEVLIINNTSNGLYLFRRDLIRELLKNYRVELLTSDTGRVDELRGLGCRVTITQIELHGKNPIKEMELLSQIKKRIQEINPIIVITYTIKPNIYGGIACKILNVPYASSVTGLGTVFEKGGLLKSIVIKLYEYALKRARVVFFENSTNLDLFVNKGIVTKEQACLLSGAGVNLEYFHIQPYPKNECLRFLFIGRIVKDKGIEELLAATKRLIEEGANCVLDIVGGLDEDYSELIRAFETEGWARYYGKQPDVRPFIKEADCLTLPSWHEGMANTNLECAASGRPIITSNIPGCREAVIEGESGLLCEPKNVDNLYETMKKMMSLTREEREKMGIAGRKHMEENFDKRKVVEKTIQRLF